jgi:hypothetical protein
MDILERVALILQNDRRLLAAIRGKHIIARPHVVAATLRRIVFHKRILRYARAHG